MTFCTQCGLAGEEGDRFCEGCGTPRRGPQTTAPSPAVPDERPTASPREPVAVKASTYGRLLRHPWWKDWVFWLWLFALTAGVVSTVNDYREDFEASSFQVTALSIDLTLAVVVQTIFFMWLPAAVRRGIRLQRSRRTGRSHPYAQAMAPPHEPVVSAAVSGAGLGTAGLILVYGSLTASAAVLGFALLSTR